MSVEEIKELLTTLSREKQDEVVAYLFHLRHKSSAAYQEAIATRLSDRSADRWLSPDDFEAALDRKAALPERRPIEFS